MLAQEYRSFAVILVDDCSIDDTAAVAERWAQRDGRIAFRRNARRLGLVGNWRRCFEVTRELFPQAEYFAWGSDHDWWAPRWLASLASALDESAAAVLAFPQPYALAEDGDAKLGGESTRAGYGSRDGAWGRCPPPAVRGSWSTACSGRVRSSAQDPSRGSWPPTSCCSYACPSSGRS